MRFLVAIVGVIGVFLVAKEASPRSKSLPSQMSAVNVDPETNPALAAQVAEYKKYSRGTYALIGAAVFGAAGCIFALGRRGPLAAVVFLVAAAVPFIFLREKVLFVPLGTLAVAGVLSFILVSPKKHELVKFTTDEK